MELLNDVDYFKVIMQMKVDLANEFEYDKETRCITLIALPESDIRGKNTLAYKKYGQKLFIKNSFINRLTRLLNDSIKNKSNTVHLNIYSENGDDDCYTKEYSRQEIYKMILDEKQEMEDLFGSSISFTDDENAFIQALSSHHLIKHIPKNYKWIARTTYE